MYIKEMVKIHISELENDICEVKGITNINYDIAYRDKKFNGIKISSRCGTLEKIYLESEIRHIIWDIKDFVITKFINKIETTIKFNNLYYDDGSNSDIMIFFQKILMKYMNTHSDFPSWVLGNSNTYNDIIHKTAPGMVCGYDKKIGPMKYIINENINNNYLYVGNNQNKFSGLVAMFLVDNENNIIFKKINNGYLVYFSIVEFSDPSDYYIKIRKNIKVDRKEKLNKLDEYSNNE